MPETMEEDIQVEEDVTKVQNNSSDIVEESQSILTEVCTITHFFREDIGCFDGTRDVVKIHFLGLDAVAGGAVLKADLTHAN